MSTFVVEELWESCIFLEKVVPFVGKLYLSCVYLAKVASFSRNKKKSDPKEPL